MAGFWYPYDGLADAQAHLCGFADGAIGPQCGVSFSDGISIVVLRRPASGLWLNVLAQHVGRPPPVPPATGLTGKLKAWFWRAMEIEGEAEIQDAEAQQAASRAMVAEFQDRVWQPVHTFLLRHKLAADTAGVALDVVGVAAGVVFLVFVAPELAAAGTVAGAVGLATGISAATGSFILAFIDGGTYVAEISGNDALAKKIDDNNTLQWMRIGATLMLLPDIGVGGMRALQEIGKLGREVNEGREAVVASSRSVAEARARVARIRHPERHPGPVMRRIHKVRTFQRAAEAQARATDVASHPPHNRVARSCPVPGRDPRRNRAAQRRATGCCTYS